MMTTEFPKPSAAFKSESQTKKKVPAIIIIVLTAITRAEFRLVCRGKYMETAKACTKASSKVRYIFRRPTISALVFSRLKRLDTVNTRHNIMEDIDIPRKFPPIMALDNCRPVAVVSFTLSTRDKSTNGNAILLPNT